VRECCLGALRVHILPDSLRLTFAEVISLRAFVFALGPGPRRFRACIIMSRLAEHVFVHTEKMKLEEIFREGCL
jgi:hypothetical protein